MGEQRERAINAPGAVILLLSILVGGFVLQSMVGVDQVASAWGFAPRDLDAGRYVTLVTALFIHGSWPHVLMNAAFALAFATPVARRLGEGLWPVAVFAAFYLICGVVGNLGYAVFNPHSAQAVVGASGAVAGMMGAASRLIGRSDDRLAPYAAPAVVGMAAAWIGINLLFGLIAPGWAPGSGGAPIAWQAHLAGYAAGLVLFAPLLRLAGVSAADRSLGN